MIIEINNKLNQKEKNELCAAFLLQVSAAISHRGFMALYQSNVSRFGQINGIFDRIRLDLMVQAKNSLDWDVVKKHRARTGNTNILPSFSFSELSKEMNLLAHTLHPSVKKKHSLFTVSRSQKFDRKIYNTLKKTNQFIQYLNDYEKIPCQNTQLTFRIKGALFALRCFIESVDTLRYTTHHHRFESLLATVINKPMDYISMGYVHDLFCHDKVAIINKNNVVAIHIAPNWLSTMLELNGSENLPDKSLKYNRFPMVA